MIGGVPWRWSFLLAVVSFPIIGINFLRSHGLLVDMANLCLLPGELPMAAVGFVGSAGCSAMLLCRGSEGFLSPFPLCTFFFRWSSANFSRLPIGRAVPRPACRLCGGQLQFAAGVGLGGQSSFPFLAVFSANSVVSVAQPPHGVQPVITTVGQPSTTKFRRLDPVRLAAAKAKFQAMLDKGVIRLSCSQWSSPLHMVKKKDGLWRLSSP
jgi:hypothetical protein